MGRVDAIAKSMAEAQALSTVEIPPMQDRVSAEEWKIRVDLAAAYRLVAHYGWDDLVFTHLSARVPGPEHHFLLNPYQLMFEEVTASSLVKVDMSGNPVEPTPFITNAAGFTIHSALHMAREDAQAVIHLHTPDGQAVSAHGEGLMPLTQTAMLIRGEIAYHDYEGVAVDLSERERLIADLGDKHAMILRNHGTLALGESVGEAFIRIYFLERACQAQIKALSAGEGNLSNPPQGAPEITAEQGKIGLKLSANLLAWPALLRKAYRLDPGFDLADPVPLQPRRGDQIEGGAEQVEDEAVEDRIFERLIAVAFAEGVGHEARQEDADPDPDQVVDEQEACRSG